MIGTQSICLYAALQDYLAYWIYDAQKRGCSILISAERAKPSEAGSRQINANILKLDKQRIDEIKDILQ